MREKETERERDRERMRMKAEERKTLKGKKEIHDCGVLYGVFRSELLITVERAEGR